MSHALKDKTPELYNPVWTCVWSLLFTPIFGALLQSANWKALEDNASLAASRVWIRSSAWLLIMFILVQALFRDEPVMKYMGIYLLGALWLGWFITTGYKQVLYVRKHVPVYRKRLMGRAIILGCAGWLVYGVVSFTIVLGLYLAGVEKMDLVPPEQQPVIIRTPAPGEPAIIEPLPPESAQK